MEYILPNIEEMLLFAHGLIANQPRKNHLAVFQSLVTETLAALPQQPPSVSWILLKALVYLVAVCSINNLKNDADELFATFANFVPLCDISQPELMQRIFETTNKGNVVLILKDWIKKVLEHGKAIEPELVVDQFCALLTHPNFDSVFLHTRELWMSILLHPSFPLRLMHHRNGSIDESEVLSAVRILTLDHLRLTWDHVIPVLKRAKELNALCYSGCVTDLGILFRTSLDQDSPDILEAKLTLVSRFADSFSKGGDKLLIELCYYKTKSFYQLIRLFNAWFENFPDHSCPQFLAQQMWTSLAGYNVKDVESQVQRFIATLECTADYPDCLPQPEEIPFLRTHSYIVYHRVMRHLESPACILSPHGREAARVHASSLLGLPLAERQLHSPLKDIQKLIEMNDAWTFKDVSAILKQYIGQRRDLLLAVALDGRIFCLPPNEQTHSMLRAGRSMWQTKCPMREMFSILSFCRGVGNQLRFICSRMRFCADHPSLFLSPFSSVVSMWEMKWR
eukprot:TRINITY_DN4638_c0_g2_i1.p1 TRINITY_DN4638_c0_g2~~TRINITY_DN4638_c0_g2_i1.p1  ORF type:complete len:509 (+),score=73.59 TRINITY_DN4638_c0_g2_i1:1928-3454(+)